MGETIMLKCVDFLKRQEKKDPADYKNRRKIAHLLRYESTKLEKGELTSIDHYIERAPEDQKDIYFLVAPNRATALASPYLEHLQEKGVEVLLGFAQLDQFVFETLQTYRQKDLVSVEKSKIEADKDILSD